MRFECTFPNSAKPSETSDGALFVVGNEFVAPNSHLSLAGGALGLRDGVPCGGAPVSADSLGARKPAGRASRALRRGKKDAGRKDGIAGVNVACGRALAKH